MSKELSENEKKREKTYPKLVKWMGSLGISDRIILPEENIVEREKNNKKPLDFRKEHKIKDTELVLIASHASSPIASQDRLIDSAYVVLDALKNNCGITGRLVNNSSSGNRPIVAIVIDMQQDGFDKKLADMMVSVKGSFASVPAIKIGSEASMAR